MHTEKDKVPRHERRVGMGKKKTKQKKLLRKSQIKWAQNK